MKQESICGEELKTEIIFMVKNLKQKNITGEALKKKQKKTEEYPWCRTYHRTVHMVHGTELILKYTHGAELKQRRQEAR